MISATLAMTNETRKGLIILWDYKVSLITQLIGIAMVFIGIVFFVGEGELTQEDLRSSILGFIITFYAMEMISTMSWSLMNEAQTGTLEQMYMSPLPSGLLLLGRSFASLIAGTIQMLLITGALILLLGIDIGFPLAAIPALLITLVGIVGFGYMVAGATIVFKQVGPLANIVQNLLLFINGTFLPTAFMPDWLATLAKILPSTQGIIVLRRIVLENASLADVWADGSMVFLLAHSAVTLIVGWYIFVYCEGVARRQGSLSQY